MDGMGPLHRPRAGAPIGAVALLALALAFGGGAAAQDRQPPPSATIPKEAGVDAQAPSPPVPATHPPTRADGQTAPDGPIPDTLVVPRRTLVVTDGTPAPAASASGGGTSGWMVVLIILTVLNLGAVAAVLALTLLQRRRAEATTESLGKLGYAVLDVAHKLRGQGEKSDNHARVVAERLADLNDAIAELGGQLLHPPPLPPDRVEIAPPRSYTALDHPTGFARPPQPDHAEAFAAERAEVLGAFKQALRGISEMEAFLASCNPEAMNFDGEPQEELRRADLWRLPSATRPGHSFVVPSYRRCHDTTWFGADGGEIAIGRLTRWFETKRGSERAYSLNVTSAATVSHSDGTPQVLERGQVVFPSPWCYFTGLGRPELPRTGFRRVMRRWSGAMVEQDTAWQGETWTAGWNWFWPGCPMPRDGQCVSFTSPA